MAQYIHQANQSLLWDTLHESKLFSHVFATTHEQSEWFQQIVQGIYEQHMGGRPIFLSNTVLEKYNRDTVLYMMRDLQQRVQRGPVPVQAHAPTGAFSNLDSAHAGLEPIAVADLRKPRNDIELRLAEHQRDLDHYLGEKRPTEIDFRMDTIDTPLDTTDIEVLLKQQKEQRMTMTDDPPTLRLTDELPTPPTNANSNTFVDANPHIVHTSDTNMWMTDANQYITQKYNEMKQSHDVMYAQLDDLNKRLERLEQQYDRMYDSDFKQMDIEEVDAKSARDGGRRPEDFGRNVSEPFLREKEGRRSFEDIYDDVEEDIED